MNNKCICCGNLVSYRELPVELTGEFVLCRDCAGDLVYIMKKFYKTMPKERFLQARNEIIAYCQNRFSEDITNIILATVDNKVLGTTNVNIEEMVSNVKNNESTYTPQEQESLTIFSNIGRKIKSIAEIEAWLGIIASIVIGIILMASDENLILLGVVFAVVGSISSWISSFVLYGFGQLIDNSDKIVHLMKNNK